MRTKLKRKNVVNNKSIEIGDIVRYRNEIYCCKVINKKSLPYAFGKDIVVLKLLFVNGTTDWVNEIYCFKTSSSDNKME